MKLLTTIIILTLSLTAAASADAAGDGIPQRQVADMLYGLAFANRKVYTRDIVQRLSNEESVVTTSEHYKDQKGLPLPAQMFRFAAEELLDNSDDLCSRSARSTRSTRRWVRSPRWRSRAFST